MAAARYPAGEGRGGYRGHRGGPPRGGRGRPGRGQFRGGRGRDFLDNEAEPPIGGRNPREHRVRRMGYKRLEEIAMKDDHTEILHTISSSQNGFSQLLESDDLQFDWITLILRIIHSALQSDSSPTLSNQVLKMVKGSKMFKQGIAMYFMQMRTSPPNKQLSFRLPIKHFLSICKTILEKMPSSYSEIFPTITTVDYQLQQMKKDSHVISEEISSSMVEVLQICEAMVQRSHNRAKNMATDSEDVDDLAPPDNFRELSVFPTARDLWLDEKPFLRSNKVHGAYRSLDHYLDVQFRLLREDFVRPLRCGVQEYLAQINKGNTKLRLQDIKLYHDVHILHPVCDTNGLSYKIRFDVYPLKGVRWQSTRRLIYGSLVCLSQDNFRTMMFATVANRDPKSLADGELDVVFQHEAENVAEIQPHETFLMAETSAFFEAYRHVLEAIKDINEENMPFQNYIVRCSGDTASPKYIKAKDTIDLSPLYMNDLNITLDYSDSDEDSDDSENEDLQKLLEERKHAQQVHRDNLKKVPQCVKEVPLLDNKSWPNHEYLGLDESQMRALKAALTRELAIIQGPPGTGKTYLGLKIVKALLYNKRLWNSPIHQLVDKVQSPMLIVCYTNHALDQFLEGIHAFHPKGIVRVGGRSKSQVLQKYYVREWRKTYRESRLFPQHSRTLYFDAKSEMESLETQMNDIVAQIEVADRGIIHEDILHNMDIIDSNHYESLEVPGYGWESKKKKQSKLTDWLGLGSFVFNHDINTQATFGEENQNLDNQVEEDEELEIEEEASFIADQRFGEPEYEETVNKKKLKTAIIETQANQNLVFDLNDLDSHHANTGGQWQVQKSSRKKNKQKIKRELTKTDMLTEDEVQYLVNIWSLNQADRWKLYRYWIAKYKDELRTKIRTHELSYQRAAERMKEARDHQDMFIMQNALVIGMTTTCAARYHNVLQQIKPQIIIVEEAAEVLEAHIMTTLSEGCKHLILIGDHQQLRPNPTVYELAEKYSLKISLFERLINNKYPVETLENQHRMRPEISSLLSAIYPNLKDHESVKKYDAINGIAHNMFFIDHRCPEEGDEELKSKSNTFEAQYIAKLCKYLILQGYEPSQITILTPYTGQLFRFKKFMPKSEFDGVRICAVDNFQGEENDIILLSLVRSNPDGKLGFLQEDNRVCVLLSRAKMGFYVVGNMEMMSVKTNLWATIVENLKDCGRIGPALNLYCQNHPDDKIVARDPRDFDNAPEGGCMRPCQFRLGCGHVCTRICHSYDKNHELFVCRKKCNKVVCDKGHKCQKFCFEICGDCETLELRTMPDCFHLQNVPCYIKSSDFSCKSKCTKTLSCGHFCQNPCGDSHTTKCNILVDRKWPCGHQVKAPCFETPISFPCPHPCDFNLDCDHKCEGSCGKCFNGRLHRSCIDKCNRILVCGHLCKAYCTKNCPPCDNPCQNRCIHSRCQYVCGKPCQPCMERCAWKCKHHQCTKLCHEACDRPRCNKPCEKLLKCGHKCIGMCGENCPTLCRVCDKDKVEEIFFGDEDEPDALFVQLEDCKHILEVKGLDTWMDMAADMQEGKLLIQMKSCPKCKTVIRRNLRYGSVINRVLNDIERIKNRIYGDKEEAKRKQRELKGKVQLLNRIDELTAETFKIRLDASSLSSTELSAIENLIVLRTHSIKTRRKILKNLSGSDLEIKDDLLDMLDRLNQWINEKINVILSDQESLEAKMEMTRISLLVDARIFERQIKEKNIQLAEDVKKQLKRVTTLLSRLSHPLKEDMEEACREILKKVEESMPRTGLGITKKERIEIVKAVGLTQGHWFKCPNGHVYAIGDCGGATVESVCPECKAKIGGQSHQLRSDNRLAPEMDGARHAAWSEQANLENYDLERLNLNN